MTLVLAIGLAIALEGAAYALFPEAMKRTLDMIFAEGVDRVRIMGAVSFAIGAAIVLATLNFS
ncbi:DUF2065 domain-containing protein [Pacificimonas sp. WHA3]|uniref:DUF2065 domain-containing protein n=1 Tax=Pacificimonas pallii TaxID=2827236 RepID=A0ABS6SGS9_9SPHN|nr:DUF2065 domain-containing protein [Pacificimonas pallii]